MSGQAPQGRRTGSFGAGRGEPYGRLLDAAPAAVVVVDTTLPRRPRTARVAPAPARELVLRSIDGRHGPYRLDAGSWISSATPADLTALDGAAGLTLDVGCGPGRMVRAAAARSIPALGIDIAPLAVARTRADGSPVLLRSVFDRVPLEGCWQTILLMDGNVGIGGDPESLLRRCRELLAPVGSVVIETDAEPELSVRAMCTVADDDGNESEPFPWARIGWAAVVAVARRAGLETVAHWEAAGRHFVRSVPSTRPA
ncbi:class I SAM-dependent methyltransferase [Agromyces italicus]|uniref:class I SAM-dependent methyltransferase n=1 Tax=Agromyces italicus TaxID=279572 RepID=UPI0003B46C14|nr:class I SAM-dependent methyltransferase [Agromyces italicus]